MIIDGENNDRLQQECTRTRKQQHRDDEKVPQMLKKSSESIVL